MCEICGMNENCIEKYTKIEQNYKNDEKMVQAWSTNGPESPR